MIPNTARRRDRRRTHGLTLIELVIGMALLALLLSLAVPSFGARMTHYRLMSTAEGLVQDLGEARQIALRDGIAVIVDFNPGPDWCYAVARTAHCDCGTALPCQLKTVRARDLPGIQLTQSTPTRVEPIEVGRRQQVAELVSRDGEHLRIEITPLGRAQLCTSSGMTGVPACD